MTDRPAPMVLIFLFLTVAFTVAGQLLVKQGMLEVGASPARVGALPAFVLNAFLNLRVLLGLGCALAAAACWTVAISQSELSFAYPFTGLSLVLVLALSPVFFGEAVSLKRWLGVLIVCFGIWIASQK